MGGSVDVSSKPGKGSNFYFTIQVTKVQDQSLGRDNMIAVLLNELKEECRLLVVAKKRSTVNMVRQLLPGVKVEGACTAGELAALKGQQEFEALIIGLSLTRDPQYVSWAQDIHHFVSRARCTIIMHYPSSGVCEFLEQNQLISEDEGRTTALITTDSNNNNNNTQSQQEPNQQKQRQRVVLRMSVPLRRTKLIRTILDILRQIADDPSTPQPSNRLPPNPSSNVITSEEKEVFSKMRILAAEGN